MVWISEEVPYSRAGHCFDGAATSPDFHRGLDVVSTPTNHARVVEFQLVPPVLPDSKDAARSRRRVVRLFGDRSFLLWIREHEVEVPLKTPVSVTRFQVLIEVILRDGVEEGHRQHVRVQPYSSQQWLKPHAIHPDVWLEEDNDRGLLRGFSHSGHLGLDETGWRQLEDTNELGKRRDLVSVHSSRRIAIGHHEEFLNILFRREVKDAREAALDVLQLLISVRNDDGDLQVLKFTTARI
mmetsp:Transcript_4005/g.9333  ORF Transcript_4005/g.9333 Transcript_4005/m.9333 type:complete len:239 (+) Transcript_4005:467-1183(+)